MKREFDAGPGATARDRDWVAAIDESYRPEPMTPWQRTAFHAALAERLNERRRVRRNWLAVAASATAALVLWLGTARVDRPGSNDSLATQASDAEAATPVVYAFVAPDQYGEAFLPDDYAALADVLDLDDEAK